MLFIQLSSLKYNCSYFKILEKTFHITLNKQFLIENSGKNITHWMFFWLKILDKKLHFVIWPWNSVFQVQITKKIQNDNSFSTHFEVMHAEFQGGEVEVGHARTVSHRAVGHTATYISLLTHSCPPFQHLLSERLMSLGIMGAPRVPHLNPSESIVFWEHYRLWGV